ncbi:uncharacterized protein ASCRUDRAFT_74204 [Ascoidea rubescens DSM 1968]|uniref:Uncharacterized protein n=1 Tax=Ascoidea rubescens DSM 1968 TaxID=1344418 RepID=A0A1D2VM82_9ASCO|nr:hypothetical protein ASCRUDRAFT_74204 [Ascoidea rubescens DSM 1968]ODV62720.1 hypothetical protein ASCRUDRAFT_74204 [Ascoidea rubescens DSM 1968]
MSFLKNFPLNTNLQLFRRQTILKRNSLIDSFTTPVHKPVINVLLRNLSAYSNTSLKAQSTLHSKLNFKSNGNISQDLNKNPVIHNHPILKRVPKSLLPYSIKFINAPISYITSFLILHELTALVPLISFWYLFSNLDYFVITSSISSTTNNQILQLFQLLPSSFIDNCTLFINKLSESKYVANLNLINKSKFIIDGINAYIIVKLLVPFRCALSLYLTPYLASLIKLPSTLFKNYFLIQPKKI